MDLTFPTATNHPRDLALLKVAPSDFQVRELFEPQLDDTGEHCYLLIRKTDTNTQWVAELLAKAFGVPVNAIGYCGLKDRRAIATQWFSVVAANPNDALLQSLDQSANGMLEILAIKRGLRKLRRGMHHGNEFSIRLMFSEAAAAERAVNAFAHVAQHGAPNYFGEQRFGSNGNNLHRAVQHFQGQSRRRPAPMVVSAGRSWLFNLVLAERVRANNWAKTEAFPETEPTGPMWGRGRNPVSAEQQAFEQQCLTEYQQLCYGLEHCGLSFERRALINLPRAAGASADGAAAWFHFQLSPGCFATTLLSECAQLQMPPRASDPVSPGQDVAAASQTESD